MSFLALLASLATGALVGLALMWLVIQRKLQLAKEAASGLIAAGKAGWQEIISQQMPQVEQLQASLKAERVRIIDAENAVLDDYEAEITKQAAALQERETAQNTWQAELNNKSVALEQFQERVRQGKQTVQKLKETVASTLEERSGLTRAQALTQVVEERVAEARLHSDREMRTYIENTTEGATIESRRIITIVVDRYQGTGHADRVQNAVQFTDERSFREFTSLTSDLRQAFNEKIACELVDDLPNSSVIVRGEDPLARELGRRVLRQLATGGIRKVNDFLTIVEQFRLEIDREVQNAGRRAFRTLGLGKAHPDVLNLVGRLKYRLSYSQNQLHHSIEVAYLAGMLAAELGLDVLRARRGGLLHDIGKAMTHDHEGSHALLGAEVAARSGEHPEVVNAIAAHHNEVPFESALSYIVTAADALSGARPGARRESVTQYLERIREIQRIAGEASAVKRVEIMQSGRDVRVFVAGEERGEIEANERSPEEVLPETELPALASKIAKTIGSEVTFAGQIRVTVIRESRAVAIAH